MFLLRLFIFATSASAFSQYTDPNQLDNTYLVSSGNTVGTQGSAGQGAWSNQPDVQSTTVGADPLGNIQEQDATLSFNPASSGTIVDPSIALPNNPDLNQPSADLKYQIAGSSILPDSSVPANTDLKNQQAFDEGGDILPFPLNILPSLGGGNLPSLPDLFNSPENTNKNPQGQEKYDPNERFADPKPPGCDDGTIPMCCNKGPPNLASQPWRSHQRRDCRRFGTFWEGCHWRQNIFCCVCKDQIRAGQGCYNPFYRGNPFYDDYTSVQRPPPPPVNIENNVVVPPPAPRGRRPQTPTPEKPQKRQTEGDKTDPPRPDRGRNKVEETCTQQQLDWFSNWEWELRMKNP